jgi:hypothetical protein
LGQGYVKFKGEQTGNETLTSNHIGKSWVNRNMKRVRISQEDNGKVVKRQTFRKGSNLSHRLAKAASPSNAVMMMLKIALMFVLTESLPTITPLPQQIWNGDEIGFEPSGDVVAVSTISGKERVYNCTTGERAPFWATAFFLPVAMEQFQ